MSTFSTDPHNNCLHPRLLLEGYCRGTYPRETVLIVNSEFAAHVPLHQYSGSMLELLNSVIDAAKTNVYYDMPDRIIPIIVRGADIIAINSLRAMVYNRIFVGLWWCGEFAYWQD